jgi:hypothetical protein
MQINAWTKFHDTNFARFFMLPFLVEQRASIQQKRYRRASAAKKT